jgi:hypothetical protein
LLRERIKIGRRFLNLDRVEQCIIGPYGLNNLEEDDVTVIFNNSQKTFRGDEAAVLRAYLERTSTDLEALPENDNPNVAKTLAELITPRQGVAIRAIANSSRIDAEARCFELYQCKPEELSRKAASSFIDYLKAQGSETEAIAG